jgi:murein DD-endopeptidase MepM/ murein hydrolase activator NlpD
VDRLLLLRRNDALKSELNKTELTAANQKKYADYLNQKLDNQTNKIQSLQISLEEKVDMYDEKLTQLNTMENKMTQIIEEFNYNSNVNVQVASSRALPAGRQLVEHPDSMTIDEINELINLDLENYDQLMKEIEQQMDFAESKPDLVPHKGHITSYFGYRQNPVTGIYTMHDGIDISGDVGDSIVASGSGIVTYAGWNDNYGKMIIVSHGYGYESVYAHNSKLLVDKGDTVKKGQVIAELGNTGRSTGPHVHFEIHKDNQKINPTKLVN